MFGKKERGQIYKRDSEGNYMARPLGSGSMVVISDTSSLSLEDGSIVSYVPFKKGRKVRFANLCPESMPGQLSTVAESVDGRVDLILHDNVYHHMLAVGVWPQQSEILIAHLDSVFLDYFREGCFPSDGSLGGMRYGFHGDIYDGEAGDVSGGVGVPLTHFSTDADPDFTVNVSVVGDRNCLLTYATAERRCPNRDRLEQIIVEELTRRGIFPRTLAGRSGLDAG